MLLFKAGISYSQTDVYEKKVQLSNNELTIKSVIKELTDKAGLNFSYNEKEIPFTKVIIFKNSNLTVKDILDEIVKTTGISYVNSNGYIILKRSKPAKKISLSGYVHDETNGESLVGAVVQIKNTRIATVTNTYGFYSLTLDDGTYTVLTNYLGYQKIEKEVDLSENVKLDFILPPETKELKEVVITKEKKNTQVTNPTLGINKISSKQIQKIPALFGETDVLKVIRLMPGVQPTNELSSSFSVRGGGKDQNLILLDEANVYNPSHLLGFFSVFNNDAIKGMDFYRGNIPAQYGGRLSSVLDVRMKDGNNKGFNCSGGIGLISSRLTLESPIVKDKGSIMISGRRTYADMFLKLSSNADLKNMQLYFYDLNLKANYSISSKDRLYLSSYLGRDTWALNLSDSEMGLSWGNNTYTLRWNHEFSQSLFANISAIYSNFDYQQKIGTGSTFNYDWSARMRDFTGKIDFSYYLNPENTIRFGMSSTFHKINPGIIKVKIETTNSSLSVPTNNALEHGFYVSNEQKFSDRLVLLYGLRLSGFQNIGEGTVDSYDNKFNFVSSKEYGQGTIFKTYWGFEPRFGGTYIINEDNSIKAGYSRNFQYIHLASNTSSGLPLDVWFPCSPNIKPPKADIYTLGFFRNLFDNNYESSAEVFYKKMSDLIDFKDNAILLMNKHLEGEIRQGNGTGYGLELMLQKKTGKVTGWISYTLSRSERKTSGVNNGRTYLSSYDRPHNLTIMASWEISKNWSVNSNFVFMTGAPLTLPTGKMYYNNFYVPVYSDRNGTRLPNYHRMDLGIEYTRSKKENSKFNSSFTLSIYNVYNHANPLALVINPDAVASEKNATIYSLPIIPTITWNFSF